ncbi:MAG: o-succinylbenzoate synthase [Planctomycetes bacterium RBG_16_43_13]|nr:MAG: o-succinylbenzoate synthase [Planctomycetes bacterium RBG_16_43_13]
MKMSHIDLSHLRLPLVSPFETSFGRVFYNDTLIIKIVADGITGWGECPASAAPYYSYETVHTCSYIIEKFLAPLINGKAISTPSDLPQLFSKVRGHNIAKAGIEMAYWDALAKKKKIPLYKLLGGKRNEIPTGISLGIEPSIPVLLNNISSAIDKGYQRIKIKIKKGWDIVVVKEVRKHFPSVMLSVDANGAYTLADKEHLRRLDPYNLLMLEQPLSYDDYVDHRILQEALRTPICLDESIRSPDDGRRAIELGSCKVINIKQARLGGTTNAIKLHDIAKKHNIPVWCGGLLESGIGRAHNIALATLPNFLLPGDISASERYYREDVIDPPVTVTKNGTIKLQDAVGIGYNVKEGIIKKYCVWRRRVL